MQRSEDSTQYNWESIKLNRTLWIKINQADLRGINPTQKKTCIQLCNLLFVKIQGNLETDRCQDNVDSLHQLSKALTISNLRTNTTKNRLSNSLLIITLIPIYKSCKNITILWISNSNSSLQTNRGRRQELTNLAKVKQLKINTTTTRASIQLTSYLT
jgi:hypothetical protein